LNVLVTYMFKLPSWGMKRTMVFFSLLFAILNTVFAQKDEIGVMLGCSFYLGDLNPNGFFNEFTRPAAGVIYRHNINNRFSYRGNFFAGTVTADDSRSSSAFQRERNLDFKSPIEELSGEFEFNFLEYETGNPKYNFSPFIFGGFGLFRMNPQGLINNQWVALQPLGTEGQGTRGNPDPPYHLIQPCIPFGIGIKTSFSKTICLTIEWGMRKTFTGYIDDVSGVYPNPSELETARGVNGALAAEMSNRSLNPDKEAMVGTERGNGKDDWYSFAGLIISFQAKRVANACWNAFQ
jgi:hypothetical protein